MTMNWKPHIAEDENGAPIFEWWNDKRKITVYLIDCLLLKVDGSRDANVEEVDLKDAIAVRAAFDWLEMSE